MLIYKSKGCGPALSSVEVTECHQHTAVRDQGAKKPNTFQGLSPDVPLVSCIPLPTAGYVGCFPVFRSFPL